MSNNVSNSMPVLESLHIATQFLRARGHPGFSQPLETRVEGAASSGTEDEIMYGPAPSTRVGPISARGYRTGSSSGAATLLDVPAYTNAHQGVIITV